jgi:hypothetical protein
LHCVADPNDAGLTATVAAIPSGGGKANTKVVDSPDLTVPDFLRRPLPTAQGMQPTSGSPAQSAAGAFTGESTPSSNPPSSPAK